MDYSEKFDLCWKQMQNKLKETITSNRFSDKHIVSYGLNFSSMCENNFNYLCFDITLKQKDEILQLKDVVGKIREDIVSLIASFENELSNNNFIVQKNRL